MEDNQMEDKLTCRDKFDIYFKYREENANHKFQAESRSLAHILTLSMSIPIASMFIVSQSDYLLRSSLWILSVSVVFFIVVTVICLLTLHFSVSNHKNNLDWLTNKYLTNIINDEDIPTPPKKIKTNDKIIVVLRVTGEFIFILGIIIIFTFFVINVNNLDNGIYSKGEINECK